MEIKKRLFGGYKKSSVDAAISELNQRIEEAQANSRTLQHEIEIKDSKISDYIKRNDELKLEIETLKSEKETLKSEKEALKSEKEALKSEKSENDLIFKNLAKIYQQAFDAGNQIVSEAKETASSLIENIDIRMDEMVRYSQNILFDYDNIHQETEELLSSLNNDISKVRQNVVTSINKAKSLTDMYSRMHDTALNTSDKINKTLDEYKLQASAFLTENISENNEKAKKNVPEIKTEHSSELGTAKHSKIFKVISNSTEKKSAPTVPENEVHPSLPTNEEVPSEIIAAAPDTTAEEIPVVNKVEQAENPEVIPPQPEQPVVSTVTDNSNPDFGFTQYGRKSKLTAQERNEFIRKALLKNGG